MLTIIVKGTNGCNLACSYCSLGEKKDFKYINTLGLIEIFEYSCNYAISKCENKITFILHGGEPTLIPIQVYEEAMEYIKKQYSDLDITFSMQTNGLVITNEFIMFARNHDIHLGISIDGSQEIHDSERRTGGGEATYNRITDNIDKLLEAGVQVSCLMVMTRNAIGKGYDYLSYFEKRRLHLKINPLLNYGEVYEHPELSLEPGDYARYLIGLYEFAIKHDIEVTISPSDNILKAIIYDQRLGECSFNKECNKNFICIDYNGDIFPCGKFSDMNEFKIGNIYITSFEELMTRINERLFSRRNRNLPEACAKCNFLKLCNGGCSAEAVIDGDFNERPILCEDYKMLFEYFSKDGLVLLKEELLRQKKQLEEKNIEL